jgi:ABC-2 type transport system permease protein
MIRMKLTILARTDGGFWGWKTWVGLAMAAGTLTFGVVGERGAEATAGVVALGLLGWAMIWILAPIQTGGASSDTLLPGHFALLPLQPQRLAFALLLAAFVGKLPSVTAIAVLVLPLFGSHAGTGPMIVGTLAAILTLPLLLVLSKVIMGAVSEVMRTRLGLEFVALQFSLLISLLTVGWMTVPLIFRRGPFGDTEKLLTDGLPDSLAAVLLWLPTGWGVAAVHAAGGGDWTVAMAGLIGLLGLTGILLQVWSRQLQNQMVTRAGGGGTRVAFVSSPGGRYVFPRTPLGAAMGRELRLWMREPRIALEVRSAILTGFFIVILPLLAGEPMFLPWIGVAIAVMAVACACNVYGLEGSALWLALSIPHGPVRDVRAKQLVYLLLFGPISLLLTVIFTALSGETWAWPWVISSTLAMVIGGTGISILISWKGAAPVPDTARRSGDLMASAENTGQAFLAMLAAPLTALPALAVVAMGQFGGFPLVAWLGVPVAIATGGVIAWWCGNVTIRGLEVSGPELLDLLRHGGKTKPTVEKEKQEATPTGWRGVVTTICWSIFWIPLAQGVAPLVFKIANVDVESWFLAPRLPEAWQWPVIVVMLGLGFGLIALPAYLTRQAQQGTQPAT